VLDWCYTLSKNQTRRFKTIYTDDSVVTDFFGHPKTLGRIFGKPVHGSICLCGHISCCAICVRDAGLFWCQGARYFASRLQLHSVALLQLSVVCQPIVTKMISLLINDSLFLTKVSSALMNVRTLVLHSVALFHIWLLKCSHLNSGVFRGWRGEGNCSRRCPLHLEWLEKNVCLCCLNNAKFGQLVFSKIVKKISTRCQIPRQKCTKFNFGWGSAPDLAEEARSGASLLAAWIPGEARWKNGRRGEKTGSVF